MESFKVLVFIVFAMLVSCQLPTVKSTTFFYPPEVNGPSFNLTSNNQFSHNYILGNVYPGDRLLFGKVVKKSSSFWRVVTEDVKFPNKTVNYFHITSIRALDQVPNGNGGYVSILKGGIGFKNVTLHLKSQRGWGFDFIIEIWGR